MLQLLDGFAAGALDTFSNSVSVKLVTVKTHINKVQFPLADMNTKLRGKADTVTAFI